MAGTNSITNPTTVAGTTSTVGSNNTANDAAIASQLGPSAFLTLLTTELSNQDPLNPVDQTQSLAQLAQFSTLQSQQTLASSFQTFQQNFGISQAAGLVGAQVSASVTDSAGATSTVSGIISGINVQNGTPYFTLTGANGQPVTDANGNVIQITQGQITSISAAGSTTSTGTGTNTGTSSHARSQA